MGKFSLQKIFKIVKPRESFWKHNEKLRRTLKNSYSILLLVLIIFTGTYFFPRDKSSRYSEYQVGTVALEEIIAPETFPIVKTDEEINSEKDEAQRSVLPRFFRDTDAEEQAEASLQLFFDELAIYLSLNNDWSGLANRSRSLSETDSLRLVRLDNQLDAIRNDFRQKYNIDIENQNWSFIRNIPSDSLQIFQRNCVQILRDIISVGMVNVQKNRAEFNSISIILIEENRDTIRSINAFTDQAESISEITSRLQALYPLQSASINVGLEIIQNFLIPNIKYDPGETERLRNEAIANVPLTRGFVYENERIIDRHERVTEDHSRKIESLRLFLSEKGLVGGPFAQLTYYTGQSGFLAIIFLIFSIYLYLFKPAIVKNNKQVTMLFLIFLVQIIFIYLILQQFQLSEYLIPTVIGSMLLAVIFDGEVGFYGTLVIALLLGGYLGNDIGIVLFTLSGGAAAILTVRRIRNRSQFFKTALYVAITYTAVLYIIGMMRLVQVSDISWTVLKFGLPNAVFSPLITLGFIAVFEIIFGVATDMTLLELSDQNRPLLRDLAIKAPGTYHHSIVIGNLSESAAEAIGANSLLARVGCYYHDIGKMVKPEYFIENQPDSMKKHEALAPSMSSLIISSHVREGIEIADKYKLPEVIKDFIMQHHGTGKISFFYEKAREKSGDKYINPADYSYPGPKPLTKETGIVMLADSVEAATRALKEPSPSRIKERVNSVIEQRFREGQLDSCELTFKDLRAIADSFIKILTGMFHVRLEYPDSDKPLKDGKSTSIQEKLIDKPD